MRLTCLPNKPLKKKNSSVALICYNIMQSLHCVYNSKSILLPAILQSLGLKERRREGGIHNIIENKHWFTNEPTE